MNSQCISSQFQSEFQRRWLNHAQDAGDRSNGIAGVNVSQGGAEVPFSHRVGNYHHLGFVAVHLRLHQRFQADQTVPKATADMADRAGAIARQEANIEPGFQIIQ